MAEGNRGTGSNMLGGGVGAADADQGENGDPKKKSKTSPAKKKLLRILTVMVYLTSITSGAFILALYYIFFWSPQRSNHVNNHVHTHRLIQEDTGLDYAGQYHTVAQRSAETPRVLPIQESFMQETTTELPFNFSSQVNSSDFFDY